MTSDRYHRELARLNEVYDVVLPEFGARQSAVSPEVASAAKKLRELFGLLSEAPLKPYYDSLGKDFFAWIDEISGQRSQEQGRVQGNHPGTPPLEDDIAITEEANHVVTEIAEEPGNGRYGVSFRHLAGIYWVRKDSPKSSDWLALLRRSLAEKRPVNFHHVVGWAQITFVELVQP